MKTFLATALIVALLGATQAEAFSFSPTNIPFTLNGTLTINQGTRDVTCQWSFAGHTFPTDGSGASASIDSGRISGSTQCSGWVPGNFPWPVVAKSATRGVIHGVSYNGVDVVTCLPNEDFRASPNGRKWIFSGADSQRLCWFSGTLDVLPRIRIVP